ALNEDANFYGESPSFQARVPKAAAEFDAAVRAFQEKTRALIASDSPTFDSDTYRAAGRSLNEAILRYYDGLDEELNVLLPIRLAAPVRTATISLPISLAAVALAYILIAVVSRNMTRPLSRCVHNLEAVAAGDLTAHAAGSGRDEVGRMTTALHHAVDAMSGT